MKVISLGLLTAIIQAAEKGKSFVASWEPRTAVQFIDENFRDISTALVAILALEWVVLALMAIR